MRHPFVFVSIGLHLVVFLFITSTEGRESSKGICNSTVCCPKTCGACGGTGCSSRPGGQHNCCESLITKSARNCRRKNPPCILTPKQVPPPPGVSNAVCTNKVCCPASCGVCGGSGCGSRPGGLNNCCRRFIEDSGRFCNTSRPPCIRKAEVPPPPNLPKTSCTSSVCCPKTCGVCGGIGCSSRPGGQHNCCESFITKSARNCRRKNPPCILTPKQVPPPPGVSNAVCRSSVCCPASCGVCGGDGCAYRPGGQYNCCQGFIEDSGRFCSTNKPPCIIDRPGNVPAPIPPETGPTPGSGGSTTNVDVNVDVDVTVTTGRSA